MRSTVTDFLNRSPTAQATVRLDLGAGRTATIWENQRDRISYDAPSGHTFSYDLSGGNCTRRLDCGAKAGWPGAVCIMPAGHSSDWEITTPFRFVHLHLPESTLCAAYARTHDCDARHMDLEEVTFEQSPSIANPLAQMARATAEGDLLLADTAVAELVGQLPDSAPRLRGGLSPYQMRRADEWIDENLSSAIRLVDLAEEAGLSEFHFHRMFRLSRGTSPHKWVMTQKIEAAKVRLSGPETIAEIADACGFACQSHLTRAFKAETGTTPGRYRALNYDELRELR